MNSFCLAGHFVLVFFTFTQFSFIFPFSAADFHEKRISVMATRGEYAKMPGKFTLLLCIPTIIHRSAGIPQLDIKSSSFYRREMSLKQTWLRKNSQSLVYSIICSAPLFTLYLLAPFLATQSRSVTF